MWSQTGNILEKFNLSCCKSAFSSFGKFRGYRNQINWLPLETVNLSWIYCWSKKGTRFDGSEKTKLFKIDRASKENQEIQKYL